jgi:uncharacterized protein (TIGR02444 family)
MSLWDDIGAVYARPGVKALCLELQNEHGHCVSYLLWAGWAAQQGRFVEPVGLAECAKLARGWERAALKPLRRMSPGVRRVFARIGVPAALASQVLLGPEHLLISALDARTPAVGVSISAPDALTRAAKAWRGGSAPAELIAQLAAAFSPR